MTVWRHAISWMRIKDALDCPARLQAGIDKKKPSDYRTNYWSSMGQIAQYTYEHYFKQKVNLTEAGRSEEAIRKVLKRVINSENFKQRVIDIPHHKTQEDFLEELTKMVVKGREALIEAGVLHQPLQSETKWISQFRGIPLFALTDFTLHEDRYVDLYDGKGNSNEDADPRQLLHYALTISASGKMVRKGGFIYWHHGWREVDLSPRALKTYVEEVFDTIVPIFQQLRQGVAELPTKPSKEACFYCNRRSVCPDSFYKKPEVTEPVLGEVNLGEAT